MRQGERAKRPRLCLIAFITIAVSLLTWSGERANAYQLTDDLEVRGTYKMESYFRLPQNSRQVFNPATETFSNLHPDQLMSQRNEFRLDIEWTPKSEDWGPYFPKMKAVVQFRPWYDSDWQLSSEGQGRYQQQLWSYWGNNLQHPFTGDATGNDPVFREYYLDITPKNFFFRIGSQIIAWGKSDGVYMLDILNNFNLRNPTIFEEENIKIPVWAANMNWQPWVGGNLQLLWMPQWFPTYWPGLRLANNEPVEGGYHDWTYGIVSDFNNFYNGQFGFKVPIGLHTPTVRPQDWIGGARWSDSKGGLNYTLNYLYTYTTGYIDYPNTGNFSTATAVVREPHRMQVIGGSIDYDLETGHEDIDGTVLRVESSETVGDQYYQGIVGNPKYVSHWGVLMGVDKTVLGDYLERPVFASVQYWHDMVTNQDRCNNCGADPGNFEDLGFQGSTSGTRGVYKSLMTIFMEKNWLEGDVVITDFFALYELQYHDWWIRPKVTYKYDDNTTFALGFNIFAGSPQTPYGQFTNNTNAFIELRRQLF
jgi:hypothetical protein